MKLADIVCRHFNYKDNQVLLTRLMKGLVQFKFCKICVISYINSWKYRHVEAAGANSLDVIFIVSCEYLHERLRPDFCIICQKSNVITDQFGAQ